MSANPFAIARRYERRAMELATAEPVPLREIRQLQHAAEAEIIAARQASALARLVPPSWILMKLRLMILMIRRRQIREMKMRKAERMIERLERRLDRLEREAGLD
jgi:hypothetical protein